MSLMALAIEFIASLMVGAAPVEARKKPKSTATMAGPDFMEPPRIITTRMIPNSSTTDSEMATTDHTLGRNASPGPGAARRGICRRRTPSTVHRATNSPQDGDAWHTDTLRRASRGGPDNGWDTRRGNASAGVRPWIVRIGRDTPEDNPAAKFILMNASCSDAQYREPGQPCAPAHTFTGFRTLGAESPVPPTAPAVHMPQLSHP